MSEPEASTRISVTAPADLSRAVDALTALRVRSVGVESTAEVKVLVERGIAPFTTMRTHEAVVAPRVRAQAAIFETACSVYVTQPWAAKSNQRLRTLCRRHGLANVLPSVGALAALAREGETALNAHNRRGELMRDVALRFAVNAVSVYDWLTVFANGSFDVSPLRELSEVGIPSLAHVVRPYVATLKKQYRMHPSISRVPRELFYYGEALTDGRQASSGDCRVELVRVEHRGTDSETNEGEIAAIARILRDTVANHPTQKAAVMVITPYRAQEQRLRNEIQSLEARRGLRDLSVEVCTFDRCQGREADYVIISLVRDRSNAFFDVPSRWNVALTRAKEGLFIVGNIDAFLVEATRARADARRAKQDACGSQIDATRPHMSVLARILEAYHSQIRGSANGQSLKAGVS